ncbi:MAG: helix-turn-helix domain-containing protein [Anaerolineales bacterium]|nr:helix-turn-helix domain-containing protein [Anaerolineales bacterium]
MSESEWITTAEAAEISGYDREYIRRLVRKKKIVSQKFGTIWQINRESFLQYLIDSQSATDQRWGPKSNN